MMIRKTVTESGSEPVTNEQGPGDTNVQVRTLFENKEDLASVTLTFANGDVKHYEALRDGEGPQDDDGEG